jgi:acyl-CoA synthetase (AMP-forming)/AMP-acid ligase II
MGAHNSIPASQAIETLIPNGEVGKAWVVLRPGAALSEAELIAWSRENMANYKAPRTVAFLDDLPRNASGKVAKLELR